MREILFRGKRTDNGEWVFGTYHYSNNYKYHYICNREKFLDRDSDFSLHKKEVHEVIPETVGQFTGLTDKNGKKIFEGDKNQIDYVILWNDEKCLFAEHYMNQFEKKYVIASYPISNPERMEIIGNIHDETPAD